MSVRRLPTFDDQEVREVTRVDRLHRNLWLRMVLGRYKGCTVFRTVKGQVQVGKFREMLTSYWDRSEISVRRGGQTEVWDLRTGIWVCE